MDYLPRVIDATVERHLKAFGAICIEGPKWCGKTWTGRHHAASSFFLSDPSGGFQNRRLANIEPGIVLQGEYPRLIDEWQEVPPIWDAVRHAVDRLEQKGCFILTGSSTPNFEGVMHSGAGRIARLQMRPMSLWEMGASSGQVSLEALCRGELEPVLTGEVELRKLTALIMRGGWPGALHLDNASACLVPVQYIDAIVNDDVNRVGGVQRDSRKFRQLLHSLARQESTTAGLSTIQKDLKTQDGVDLSWQTVGTYLDILKRLFVIDDQPPFSPSVRSSVRVKQAAKRHFCDPSLAAALLGITADGLTNDLTTCGFLFEALCERDLRIYAESFGGKLFHYQDYKQKEIDAVVELPDGTWTAFEIKLGANQIDAAAASLLSIKNDFEKDSQRPPSQLCVLCGMSNAAYKRPDGVFVVPLTALKP